MLVWWLRFLDPIQAAQVQFLGRELRSLLTSLLTIALLSIIEKKNFFLKCFYPAESALPKIFRA